MAPPSHVLEHGAHCDQVDHSGSSGSLVLSKKQTLATIMIGNEIDRLHSSNHSTWSLPHEYIIIFCVYIYIYSSQHKTGEEGFGDDDKWRLSSVLKGKDDVDGRVRELYRAVVSLFIVYFDGALAMPREIDTQRKKIFLPLLRQSRPARRRIRSEHDAPSSLRCSAKSSASAKNKKKSQIKIHKLVIWAE